MVPDTQYWSRLGMSSWGLLLLVAMLPAMANRAHALTIDFDNVAAPGTFGQTTALTTLYASIGVQFSGPVAKNGGGILNNQSGYPVQPRSGANFLAFNPNSTFGDGGKPIPPVEIRFTTERQSVSLWFAAGSTYHLYAFSRHNTLVGEDSGSGNQWQQLSVASNEGIAYVAIDAPGAFVVDDLEATELAPVLVVTPNGGESFMGDAPISIHWNARPDIAGTAFEFELWNGFQRIASLGNTFEPSGEGTVTPTLPLSPEGDDYRIRVVSIWDENYWDESDQPFSIQGGVVKVKSQSSGAVWPMNTPQFVHWKTNPQFSGTAVRIELLNPLDQVTVLGIAYSPGGEDITQITVPELTSGTYRLRIVSLWDEQFMDEADGLIALEGIDPRSLADEAWMLYH